MFISVPKAVQTGRQQYHRAKEGRQCQMKSGPVPGQLLGPGQQKAQARGRKGVGKVSRSWRHKGSALGRRNRERGRGQPAGEGGLRLHVEHVGRALVVPVPEAGVAWAL